LRRVRFRADNDLDRDIVNGLLRKRPRIDFESSVLHGVADLAVLTLAAGEGRLLVSHDVTTLPPLFARFRKIQRSPGVLLTPQRSPIGQTIELLGMIWELKGPEDRENRICLLPTLADFVIGEGT